MERWCAPHLFVSYDRGRYPISPISGWEVGIYFTSTRSYPRTLNQSRQTLEINIQIWKFKPSVADCFRKCMGDKSATFKNQSKSQNPPYYRGSQTHRRRHISQPPMRVHQLFGLFGTPASSCGRHRCGGQRCRKKPGFETSNNTQHKSSFMGHLSLASFSWAGHPAASDFSLNFWRKNSRQIRWTLQQHR